MLLPLTVDLICVGPLVHEVQSVGDVVQVLKVPSDSTDITTTTTTIVAEPNDVMLVYLHHKKDMLQIDEDQQVHGMCVYVCICVSKTSYVYSM